jgi:thiol-disulfide isomerase/thioredoxin
MLSRFCRYILLGLICIMAFAPISAQVRLRGVVTDTAGKPIEAKVYVCRAIDAGFHAPERGAVDSVKTKRGRFAYTFRRADAYFLCVRGANKTELDIPLVLESAQPDSIIIAITIQSRSANVSAEKPFDYVADMYAVHRYFSGQYKQADEAYDVAQKQSLKPSPFNDSAVRKYLLNITTSADKHINVRRLAAYYLAQKFPAGQYDSYALAQFNGEVLPLLPYNSYHWSWGGQNAIGDGLMADTTRKFHEMLAGLCKNNSEVLVRRFAMMNRLSSARYYHQDSLLQELCAELKRDYLESKGMKGQSAGMLQIFQDMFRFNCGSKSVVVGQSSPDFKIRLYNDKQVLTKASMLGKTYLIDFWGTWCSGCVLEIPRLEDLYKKYSDKGFVIISLNNESSQKISQFRKNRYPMPWFHGKVSEKEWGHLQETFETFFSFPNPILIGADGTILANRGDAMGDRLKAKLEAVFEKK